MFLLAILTIFTFTMTVRSVFVLTGTYKDPLLASFEQYGDEKVFSPMLALVIWATAFIYVSLYWYFRPAVVFGVGIFVGIPVASIASLAFRWLDDFKDTLRRYPQWCHELIQITDREERRRIAYMWLSLPPSTRMIYNANNRLFWQWVEQVLVTVAQ